MKEMPKAPGASQDRRALLDLIAGKWLSQAVSACAELGIADILKEVPRSADEIAAIFDYLARDPDAAAILNDAMTSVSTADATAVVQAYDFSPVRTLVDVGGGHGLMLATVLKAHPHMRGVLFERPHAIEGASALLKREGVAPRCEVVSGDFFRSVPEGGDAYLLKLVLHDWDDERALQILRNCQRVMRPNGTLLLIDFVLRAGDERDLGKFADLEMLVLNSGGRERTELESGFRLTQIVPTVTPKSVIEAVRS